MYSVLLVEDSLIDQKVAKRFLEKSKAFTRIEVAVNGVLALEKLRQEQFDCVVLDLNMPQMGGIDVLKNMPKDFQGQIFILSSSNHPSDLEQLSQFSFINAILTKPINLNKIETIIINSLRS